MNLITELKNIIEIGGITKQKTIAIEELSELIKELTKDLRGIANDNNITEEISDCIIIIIQLLIIYDIKLEELYEFIEYKINRTKERLGI